MRTFALRHQNRLKKKISSVKMLEKSTKNNLNKSGYKILKEHNYFHDFEKINYRWYNKKNVSIDLTMNNDDNNDEHELPYWLNGYKSSSDDENYDEVKSLSQLLKIELEKELAEKNTSSFHEFMVQFLQCEVFISTFYFQRHFLFQFNLKSREIKYITNEEANYIYFEGIINFQVCPPFDWINLIYLTVKNSSTEYVTCYDVQTFSRFWFPYYLKNIWIEEINLILNLYSKTYFNCLFSIIIENCSLWTVNDDQVITLENMLMSKVENYENEIKSALIHPDKLSILLRGYDVFKLGHREEKKHLFIDN